MTTEATIPQVLDEATLAELEQGVRGQLIRPSDEGYDAPPLSKTPGDLTGALAHRSRPWPWQCQQILQQDRPG